MMNIEEQLEEWKQLAKEPERIPMTRQQGLPTPAGRVLQVEIEMRHLRRALSEACAAVQILLKSQPVE